MKELNKEFILECLEKKKESITKFGIKKIILFGSYAQDNQNEFSDIDFLIKFKKNRGNYDDYIKLLHFLEDLFHKKIDLVEPEYVKEELKKYVLEGKQYEARV